MKKFVIYCRVSTEMQEESDSLANQIKRCQSYCEMKGFDVVKIYSDVESGAKDDRKEFQEMMKGMEYGVYDGIVVTEISRISRKMTTLNKFMESIQMRKIDFVSITQDIDTGSLMGKTFFNLLGVLAEFERGQTRERVKHTISTLAKNGKHTGGQAPFGYVLKNKKLHIKEEESKKIKEMYKLFLAGYSQKEISVKLEMTVSQVNRIINSPFYTGLKIYNTKTIDERGKETKLKREKWKMSRGEHEAIIDKELFERVQAIIKSRSSKVRNRYGSKTNHLLKGLVRCYCGNIFYNKYGKGLDYYVCSKTIVEKEDEKCCKKSMSVEELDKSVIEYIFNLNKDDCNIDEEETGNINKDIEKALKEIEMKLEKVKIKDNRLVNLLLEDTITNDEFLLKKQELGNEIKKLEKEKEYFQAKKGNKVGAITNKKLFFDMVEELKNEKDNKKIRRILQLLIYEVVFINDFEYKIIFNI